MAPSEARRDRWGRYLVVPPGGGKPQGYTRATTVAKTLDDQGGLMPWKAAMALTGLMRSPGKRASLEALVSQHPEKGPWYGTDESKKAIKKLVEECAEAGGSTDRADIGTALHAIIEQIGRGQPVTISQDSTRADVEAYRDLVAQGQIEFLQEYIEATFVLDRFQVAGTADGGAVRIPWLSDKLLIADLKTGSNLEYSGQAIGVQLATYAHGDAHYIQGDVDDGSQDERRPMPELDQEKAVVIHLPAGEARAQLYTVDIAAGWEAFERSIWARDWRKRKDLLVPVDLEKVEPPKEEPRIGELGPIDGQRLMLLELIKALPVERQEAIKAGWPSTLPPLKNPAHWTDTLLRECAQYIAAVASGARAVGTGSATPPAESVPTSDAAAGPDDEQARVERFLAMSDVEQERAIERGHLPESLRVPAERLGELRGEVSAVGKVGTPRRDWLETHAQIAGLPNLGHDHLWTVEREGALRALLDTADQLTDEQLAPPDWVALCKSAGLTQAAAARVAKDIAVELELKVPAKVKDLPTDGVFAVLFRNWIDLEVATRADAA